VISSSQRPLPDNTQPSQQTSSLCWDLNPQSQKWPQTYLLDHGATGTDITDIDVRIKCRRNYSFL